MCKIAGWIDFNNDLTNKSKIIDKMSKDNSVNDLDNGVYMQKEAVLIQFKKQTNNLPLTISAKGDIYSIVFCGSIYNAKQINNELNCLGYNFKGDIEAETVLYSYIEWGGECLNKFNGFFAFAVWKENEKSLFIARDRVGAKPLFFYNYNGGLIFASEIKILLNNPIIKPEIDEQGLKELFLLGPGKICGSGIIKGVKELKPGYLLYFDKYKNYNRQYWKLKAEKHKDNLKQTKQYLRFLLTDSVKKQLCGKSDVACMLSGGLDSSVISYITANIYKEKGNVLNTYSVDYKDNLKYFEKNKFQPDSDSKYIPLMTDILKSNHKNIVLDNLAVAKAVKEALKARDLPGMADIDSSLLLFLKEIGNYDKICFTGECSDEFLGGYPWYNDEKLLFSDTFPWSKSLNMRKQLLNKGLIKGNAEEYVNDLYNDTIDNTDFLPDDSKLDKRTRQMFMLNFYWFMQTLIDRNDRMSSFSKVETRVPYCDHRIIEYAFNMPRDIKLYKGREKGILRLAFEDVLPENVVWRKKSPYPKSFNPIIYDYAKSSLNKILNDKNSYLSQILNKNYITQLMNMSPLKADPFYGQLMRLPQLFGYLVQIEDFLNNFNIDIV